MRVHTYTYEIPVTVPTMIDLLRTDHWTVMLHLFHWRRGRGQWPSHFAEPIFLWWQLGPLHARRFRFGRWGS
jgi:hypothetical protein